MFPPGTSPLGKEKKAMSQEGTRKMRPDCVGDLSRGIVNMGVF